MLSYLSDKFYQEPTIDAQEPRAALFLNRFTRTSTVMYATQGVSTILGLQPSDIIGKSFYYCIEENCLQDAVKCLESAKANDSIAYLRFWYRDPLQADNRSHAGSVVDDDEDDDGGVSVGPGARSGSSVSMEDVSPFPQPEGGARLSNGGTSPTPGNPVTVQSQVGRTQQQQSTEYFPRQGSNGYHDHDTRDPPTEELFSQHRSSSDHSTDLEGNAQYAIFDRPEFQRSSSSQTPPEDLRPEGLEIEAVVSCTSDGLVVILRKARPLVPHTLGATDSPYYANGLFASPWASEPVVPSTTQQTTVAPATSFPMTDPTESGFMAAIRDVAVFAWSLTGINGSLAQFAKGTPAPEALPSDGLPIWNPEAEVDPDMNERHNGFLGSHYRPSDETSQQSGTRRDDELGSSDDEVLWKRTPTMPTWRRPKRRAHNDAFGADGSDGHDGENQDGGRKRATRSQSASGPCTGSGSGVVSTSGEGSSSGSN